MSRYIDADALIEKIDNIWNGRPISFLGAKILAMIDDAPSIDIVRCGECKHRYDDGWIEPRWTCDYLKDMRLKDDDFCSYGERRASDDIFNDGR